MEHREASPRKLPLEGSTRYVTQWVTLFYGSVTHEMRDLLDYRQKSIEQRRNATIHKS